MSAPVGLAPTLLPAVRALVNSDVSNLIGEFDSARGTIRAYRKNGKNKIFKPHWLFNGGEWRYENCTMLGGGFLSAWVKTA